MTLVPWRVIPTSPRTPKASESPCPHRDLQGHPVDPSANVAAPIRDGSEWPWLENLKVLEISHHQYIHHFSFHPTPGSHDGINHPRSPKNFPRNCSSCCLMLVKIRDRIMVSSKALPNLKTSAQLLVKWMVTSSSEELTFAVEVCYSEPWSEPDFFWFMWFVKHWEKQNKRIEKWIFKWHVMIQGVQLLLLGAEQNLLRCRWTPPP